MSAVDAESRTRDARLEVDQAGESSATSLVELGQEEPGRFAVHDRGGETCRDVDARLPEHPPLELRGQRDGIRRRGPGRRALADDVEGVVGEAQHGRLEVRFDDVRVQEAPHVVLLETAGRHLGAERALADEHGPGHPPGHRRRERERPGEGHLRAIPLERQLLDPNGAAGKIERLDRSVDRHSGGRCCHLRQREDAGRGQQQNEGGQPHSGDDP